MARSHAKIFVQVWGDPDYQSLGHAGQWLYVHILAHPRLSLVGTIDLWPSRWARLACDVDEAFVADAMGDLWRSGFVVVDTDTEELLVRSFARHDLAPGRVNRNLAGGFWRSWGGVLSPILRSIAVHEIPDPLWDRLADYAPPVAVQTRTSPRLEPQQPPRLEPPSDLRSRPTPTPTPTPTPPADAYRIPSSQSDLLPDEPSPDREACILIGHRRHDAANEAGGVTHPDRHRAACVRRAIAEHLTRAGKIAAVHPDWTAEQIADRLDTAPSPTVAAADSTHPAVVAQRRRADEDEPTFDPVRIAEARVTARAAAAAALGRRPDYRQAAP